MGAWGTAIFADYTASDAQMETGRLLPEVRDCAVAMIDAGGDVDRWREEGDASLARRRARALERLASKLPRYRAEDGD